MNLNYRMISTAVVIAVVLSALFFFLKRWRAKKFNQLLLKKDFNTFDQQIEDGLSLFLYSKHTRLSYKLSKAFLVNDINAIESLFDELETVRVPVAQREKDLMQAFNYYVAKEDAHKSKETLDKIKQVANPTFQQEAEIMYDIYIEKGDKYLQLLLDKISEQDPMYSGIDEFLVSKIYENKGEKKLSNQYYKQAQEHIQQLDHMIAQSKQK